jgi:hypothetical protein
MPNEGPKGLKTPMEASSPYLVPEPRCEGQLLHKPESLGLLKLILQFELVAGSIGFLQRNLSGC